MLQIVSCKPFDTTKESYFLLSAKSTSCFSKLMGLPDTSLCKYDHPRHVEEVRPMHQIQSEPCLCSQRVGVIFLPIPQWPNTLYNATILPAFCAPSAASASFSHMSHNASKESSFGSTRTLTKNSMTHLLSAISALA